jgi:hypothetical protein
MTLVTASLLLFALLDQHSDFWNIVPGLVVGGLGMALTMAPTTAAALGAVSNDKAGVGSAVLNAFRQVGGSLGIAIMGALVASRIHAVPLSPRYPAEFVDGYHVGLHVAAGFALLGAVIAVLTVRKYSHAEQEETKPALEVAA